MLYYVKKIISPVLLEALRPPYHFFLAWWAAFFYGFPSRRLFVIGVTGTKGKTTVVELLHEILKETGAGVASISSLRFKVNDREERNELKMTMPGRMFVQKFLHKARRGRCKYVVLEVTSEGIKQFRHRFINFDAAVMTNVAPEHIEAHGSFENYLRAKLDLFWRLSKEGLAVLNQDDEQAVRFRAATPAHILWYGKDGIGANGKTWSIRDLSVSDTGITFDLNDTEVYSPLQGGFNFYNMLAACAVGLNQHVSVEQIAQALSRVGEIPGRLEYVQRESFAVVVDYAHTPDSLKSVYTFLRESNSKFKIPAPQGRGSPNEIGRQNSKLICVFGATGGGRDKCKRPEFGKIAAELCDEIILTDEDSYDEPPEAILKDIEVGIGSAKRYTLNAIHYRKILDRREAIREALKSARPGDTVICTGKGAEPWIMGPNGSKTAWDERDVVREELKKVLR